MIIGTVISDKMDKTVTIELKTRKRHPLYKKFVKQHMKIKAHDEKNEVTVGDLVKIVETRPISKDKCWKVTEILKKA
ncbi:MAG: 30S ribosomal protein S17 [Candidatus Omnitrophota bacterium]